MNLAEVEDRLIKVTNFPEKTSEGEFKAFFSKLTEVATIQRFDEVVYIVFADRVKPSQLQSLDLEDFVSQSITIKHFQNFTDLEKQDVQKHLSNGSMNISSFEFINKTDKKDPTQDEAVVNDESQKRHDQDQSSEDEDEEEDEVEDEDENEASTRQDGDQKDQQSNRQKVETKAHQESYSQDNQKEDQAQLKRYSQKDQDEKKRSDELLKSSTRGPQSQHNLQDQSGKILFKPELLAIIGGLFITCQLSKTFLGY